MWTVGQEKQVQMDLSVLNIKSQNIDYIISHLYKNLLPEGKQFNSLEKLYELLLNSLVYGQSVKTIQIECPYCKGITENDIDVLNSIEYTPSNTPNIDNSEMDLKEFLDVQAGALSLKMSMKCLLCQKEIVLNVDEPQQLIENYIFSYSLMDYYQLILFFKEFNFSVDEINNFTPLEVKYIQKMIIEREEKRLQEIKNRDK